MERTLIKAKLAFYKANCKYAKLDDKLIAWWTNGLYSHVELVYNISSGSGECLRIADKNGYGIHKTTHYIDNELWDYIYVEIDKNVLDMFYKFTENDKYDWIGLLGFILPLKDRTNQWFCSEGCSNILKCSGDYDLIRYEPSDLSPNDLYYIKTGKRSSKITFLQVLKHLFGR